MHGSPPEAVDWLPLWPLNAKTIGAAGVGDINLDDNAGPVMRRTLVRLGRAGRLPSCPGQDEQPNRSQDRNQALEELSAF